ncbi:hypothetical protein F0266_11380 [Vibrio coralliilyticus]|uniref:tight adherence pilus pseudopilin TadF n=1 Tax=Vibrio coralliilyticus TaxID=190893 RepID=UPI00148B772C|nr:tight adherence pilus pseudopilin TadF [Vibrio coralliilyticus]NOH53536.1 hypothetical protein [Vibrio coralliilyticus]
MMPKIRMRQKGATIIEFPFVALAVLVISITLVAIFKTLSLQAKIDNTAFSLVSAASLALVPKTSSQPYTESSAAELLTLAKRYLPANIEPDSIGISLDMSFRGTVQKSLHAGASCNSRQSIASLSSLSPEGDSSYSSIAGRTADLYQVTLCINSPLESSKNTIDWLYSFTDSESNLPMSMSSQAVMIGRIYGS